MTTNEPPPLASDNIQAILQFLPIFESPDFQPGQWHGKDGEFPGYEYTETVTRFVQALYDNQMIVPFDWSAWEEGKQLTADSALLETVGLHTLRKLLTTHVRADRFVEGHLAQMFESGHILAILRRMREIQSSSPGSTIYFYETDQPYGEFSNFYQRSIEVNGKTWPTSEHYFQAQKFAGTPVEEAIRQAASPMQAAHMGRDRSHPLRVDWEKVKDDMMRQAVRAKFTQHPDLAKQLFETGHAILVEHTRNDSYWADGGDGSGKNRLGQILMEIRQELQNEIYGVSE